MEGINQLELAGLGLYAAGFTLLVVVWGFARSLGWLWTIWFSLEALALVAAGAAVTLGYYATVISGALSRISAVAPLDLSLTLQPSQALIAALVLLALGVWHLVMVATMPARTTRRR